MKKQLVLSCKNKRNYVYLLIKQQIYENSETNCFEQT